MRALRWAGICVAGLVLAGCSGAATTSGSAASTTSTVKAAVSGSTTPTTAAAPKGSYTVGTTVKVPVTIDGIDSATLSAVYPNVASSQSFETPTAGTTWYGADASECAGSKGSNTGANASDFSLLLSNGSTAQSAFVTGPLTGPMSTLSELGGSNNSLAAGQCDRGFVVWTVPSGTTPTAVQFSGTTASFSQGNSVVKWPVT
jgi:hypothetical protein